MESEFVDLGLARIRDVYVTPLTHLATFGGLGVDGAMQVHAYIKRNMLLLPINPVQNVKDKVVAVDMDRDVSEEIIEVSKEVIEVIECKRKGKLRDTVDWSSDSRQETSCEEEEEVDKLEESG